MTIGKLVQGGHSWLRTLSALMRREVLVRFSGGDLGYAWAFLVPLAWVLSLTAFFVFLGREAPIYVDLPSFIATGMLPYLFFRTTVNSMMRIEKAHRHLQSLGAVEPGDLFSAAALLELVNAIMIFTLISAVIAIAFTPVLPADPLGVLSAIAIAWALGVSFGRLAAVVSLASAFAERSVPIVLRPLFWVSGVFFTASELPGVALDILWFNPLLHVSELLRDAFFAGYTTRFADLRVPLSAIAGFYFLSHALEPEIRRREALT